MSYSLSTRRRNAATAAAATCVPASDREPRSPSSRLRLRGVAAGLLGGSSSKDGGGGASASGAVTTGPGSATVSRRQLQAQTTTASSLRSPLAAADRHSVVVVDMGTHQLKMPALGAAYNDIYDGVQVRACGIHTRTASFGWVCKHVHTRSFLGDTRTCRCTCFPFNTQASTGARLQHVSGAYPTRPPPQRLYSLVERR